MAEWKLFYRDGTTFTDLQGDWTLAPQEDVVTLLYAHNELGRKKWTTWSYFFFLSQSPMQDPYPLASNDLVPTLIRMGLTPPSPFPDDPRSWLTSQGIIQYFKFGLPYDEALDSPIHGAAALDTSIGVGVSPNNRFDDGVTEDDDG